MRFLRFTLFPISIIYSSAVFVRNRLFDWGFLKQKKSTLPSIVIGNLSTGGTGKTPHTQYFIELIQNMGLKPAVLSRGYGRKTKGYILANSTATASSIGDEPFQIYSNYPHIPLAVCEDRLLGLEKMQIDTTANLVLLDDAFQHRKLKAHFNVLLTTYQKPFWKDHCLPSGNLRDNRYEKRRADLLIITKCPHNLSQLEMTQLATDANLSDPNSVFFSVLQYQAPVQLSGTPTKLANVKQAVGFAGIAQPMLFEKFLKETFNLKKFKSFPDHYIFSQSDLDSLASECGKFGLPETILVTTEKDAMRLKTLNALPSVPIFYVPIKVKLLNNGEAALKQRLLSGVLKHKM